MTQTTLSTVDAAWSVSESPFRVEHAKAYEGLFTLGSGYLHVRGSLEGHLSDAPQNVTYTRMPTSVTSEQFRQKRDEYFASRGPLEQAKAAAAMKQWQTARDLAAAALDKDPKCPEALLMMGLLHESCCLNEPDKAIECYGRLAAIKDNPPAAFAGLVHQYRLQIEAKRYAEALRVGTLIEQKYPRNSSSEVIGRYNRWLEKRGKGSAK